MIEAIMFFGGGFLVASLFGLVLISVVHHRAVRLTERRLADAIPVSMSEIQADKDNLRAEFAMSARRLEMNVEQLKAKTTSQLADIARKTEAINRLKSELAEKTVVTDELDATAKSLAGKVRETEQGYEVKSADLEATLRALAAREAELAKAANDINEQRLASDTQRVEIAVLKTQVEQFKSQIEELQHDVQDSARRLFEERVTVSTVTKELEEKRQAVDILRPQVAQLEREIAAATTELGNRARRIDELETHNGEQENELARRAGQIRALQQDIAANKDEHAAVVRRMDGEKSAIETSLASANQTIESHARHIDDIEARNTEQQLLLARRDDEIRALQQDIAAKEAEHDAVAERLNAEMHDLENLLGAANNTVDAQAARIGDLENGIAERDRLVGSRDAEIKALHDQIAATKEEHDAQVERWEADKDSLARLLQTANHTLETRADRIEDLEGWVAERDELLRERDAAIAGLVEEIATIKDGAATVVDRLRAEKAKLESQLQIALEGRNQAQIELTALNHEAEATWRAERVENALLRERMNDIAAQVAHMVMTMDKAGPIEAILTESEGDLYQPAGDATDPAPQNNLTDRIRKLKNGSSRAFPAE